MNEITIEPLTVERFAPFGDVFAPPPEPGRLYANTALASERPGASPSLSLSTKGEAASVPLTVSRMERHAFSSQSFVPLQPTEMLVVVAPHGVDGRPLMSAARAFKTAGRTGLTFGKDVWHHPLTILSAPPASFAVFMWLDGGPTDEEFVDVTPTIVKATV